MADEGYTPPPACMNYLSQIVVSALIHRAEVVDYELGGLSLP